MKYIKMKKITVSTVDAVEKHLTIAERIVTQRQYLLVRGIISAVFLGILAYFILYFNGLAIPEKRDAPWVILLAIFVMWSLLMFMEVLILGNNPLVSEIKAMNERALNDFDHEY